MNRHSYLLSGLSDSEGVSIGFSHDGTNNAAAKMVSYPARALPPNPCCDKSMLFLSQSCLHGLLPPRFSSTSNHYYNHSVTQSY